MFVAICTPSDPQDDFIVPNNCYNVLKGPNRVPINPETGPSEELAWTSFHEFASISPKLMIVLRSSLLLSSDEVFRPSEKAARDRMWSLAVGDIFWKRNQLFASQSSHLESSQQLYPDCEWVPYVAVEHR